jgi:outer membrane protein OmpA-like peptidoglycan-associated protein
MQKALALGSFVAIALLSATAAADPSSSGFQLDRFEPSERGSEWFAGDSLDLRGHMRPAAGIVGSYAYKPLVVYNGNGDERGSIVSSQLVTHLGGSLVLWDRLRAGLDIPIALFQDGDNPAATGVRTGKPKTAFGDIRLAGDVRIIGTHGDPFQLAGGLVLFVPTGSRDNYTSDGNTRFMPRVLAAGDISLFTYAASLGFDYRPLTDTFHNTNLGSNFILTTAAGVRLLDHKELILGPELWATATTSSGSFFAKASTPVEGILGGHYTYTDFRFGAGVGTGLTRGWGAPAFRALLSAEWAPAIKAPPPPPPAPLPPPPPPPDRDNDGILDQDDACPDTPGIKTDDPKTNGCPAPPPPPPDRDGDTIIDSEDACPDVPGVKNADPKKNGCPSDRDDDGIVDTADACPDAPGPANADPKKNGCPLARIEDGQVKITEQVKFKTASAEILPESSTVLTAVALILRDHPEITKVTVEGHTDNKGAAAYNKDLSKKRAASVATWLIRAGIAKDRMASTGFGLEKPIDSNDTEEGRQNNRRVEFHVIEMKKKDDASAPPTTPKKP